MTNIDSIKKKKKKSKGITLLTKVLIVKATVAQTVRNSLVMWETWVWPWEGHPCSPVVRLGAPQFGSPSSFPSRGIRSHILQLKILHVKLKILPPTCYSED